MTPVKTPKEAERQVEKEEEPEEPAVVEEDNNNIDDELIIKDELDNDCFEEVDRIGEIEKEVSKAFSSLV